VAVVEQAAPPPVAAAPPSPRSVVPASIIPLAGLPAVAAIVIALVVSIKGNWPWALDFFHVVGGGLWTGADLFLGFIIGPIMRRLTIPARIELTTRLMPKMLLVLPTLVVMTLASGFQLARLNGMLDTSYSRHAWVVASMVVVAVMAITALGLLQPANIAVLFELRKEQPNPVVIQSLMRRFIYGAAVLGVMQLLTLLIMTRLAS
jgi:hypothetical protein